MVERAIVETMRPRSRSRCAADAIAAPPRDDAASDVASDDASRATRGGKERVGARSRGVDAVAGVDRDVYEEFRATQDVADDGAPGDELDVRVDAGDGRREGNAGEDEA